MTLEHIFSGNWNISRKLNGEPFFSGSAEFKTVENSDLISYREEGEVDHLGGYSGLAFREYYFSIGSGAFLIHFDKERMNLFNSVQLHTHAGRLVGSDVHNCLQDIYRSEFIFQNQDLWVWNHKVSGPKKDYALDSEFRRCKAGASDSRNA